ncbi:MAG: hypothetical protein ACR2FV_10540, partial [Ornithinimicrobium sp.]|uniref:hypothetical protein n=1 Tax=Ornithinimicrobium sp. TaxID=1977084 RepID=UPI003D9B2FF2
MFQTQESQRSVGRFAWVMAWFGLVAGQLHALARHGTAEGSGDLEMPLTAAWSVPASEALAPLLEWGDPDLVYVTYGKVWLPVFVAFTLCAFLVHRRRAPRGFEKWAWRVTLTGYTAACVAVFLQYWTQWTSEFNVLFDVAWLVTVPAMLVTMLSSTLLGATLLVRRFRPLLPALLLVAAVPMAIGIVQVTSMGSAA